MQSQFLCNLAYGRDSPTAILSNMSFHRYTYRNYYAIGTIATAVTSTPGCIPLLRDNKGSHRVSRIQQSPPFVNGTSSAWDRRSPNHFAEPSQREKRGREKKSTLNLQ